MSSRGVLTRTRVAAQLPVDFPGQQFPGLLQSAAGIEQTIHAFARFPVEIGDAPIADMRWRFDFGVSVGRARRCQSRPWPPPRHRFPVGDKPADQSGAIRFARQLRVLGKRCPGG